MTAKKVWLKESHDTYSEGTCMTIKEETEASYKGEIEFFGYTIDNITFPKSKCTNNSLNELSATLDPSVFGDETIKLLNTIVEVAKKSYKEDAPKNNDNYDSTVDTLKHIKRVNQLLTEAASELIKRANCHDDSKLVSPEKELYDKMTPMLAGLTYGSDEYKKSLADLGPALKHHYENNSHHPEFYEKGIDGMDLFDIIEMAVDWKAAGERHKNGSFYESIKKNKDRFKMSDQLVNIFENTAKKLGWK